MKQILKDLKQLHEDSEDVWLFVTSSYKILGFNKVAFHNSKSLHGKELMLGESILDYARDTNNNIDELFINCLGRACSGQTVQQKQCIEYDSGTINTISTYTPIYNGAELLGISINVQITPSSHFGDNDNTLFAGNK